MCRLRTILGTAVLLSLMATQASAQVVCEGLTAQHPLTYRSPTYGYSLAYPASMEIVPDSISERGDTVRFEAPRWQVTASITTLLNNRDETLSQLQREAQQDIIQNSHGSITYQRNGTTWFVLSGYILDRIYYQPTVLIQGNLTTSGGPFTLRIGRFAQGSLGHNSPRRQRSNSPLLVVDQHGQVPTC